MINGIPFFLYVLGAWVILKVISDYGYIKSISWLWHSGEAAIRVMWASYTSHLVLGEWTFSLVFLSFYWLTFDLALNILRGKKALYVGQTAGLDIAFTIIGGILKKDPGVIMLITKIIVLAISGLIFYWRF